SGAEGGGEILVGGNKLGQGPEQNASITIISSDVTISADASEDGRGGKVIVWSDEYTKFSGEITARGGENSGDGGFIETSSKGRLDVAGSADASASNGNGGSWLLDPQNITINSGSTDDIVDAVDGGDGFDFTLNAESGGANESVISVTTIQNALHAGNNVVIDTASNGGGVTDSGAGNITVTGEITMNSGLTRNQTLTLTASNNIDIDANISAVGDTLNLTLNAAGVIDLGADITLNGGTFIASNAVDLSTDVTINSGGGAIRFDSTVNGNQNLTLVAGGGNIDFNAAVGASTALNALAISSARNVTADSTIAATSLSQTTGTGTTTLSGGVTTSSSTTIST
ncbi:MAG: hypothetical protein VW778_09145, partial [Betaproteobacteria bacterium]